MRVTAYRSDREAKFEAMRKKNIANNVQKSEVLLQRESERRAERVYEKYLFCSWFILDKELERFEKIRDKHAPKSIQDEWDDAFCYAIEKIHEVKELCKDIWFEYINYNR